MATSSPKMNMREQCKLVKPDILVGLSGFREMAKDQNISSGLSPDSQRLSPQRCRIGSSPTPHAHAHAHAHETPYVASAASLLGPDDCVVLRGSIARSSPLRRFTSCTTSSTMQKLWRRWRGRRQSRCAKGRRPSWSLAGDGDGAAEASG
jgi:hypothetical protein